MSDFSMPHGLSIAAPTLGDYFGLWAMHEQTFREMAERCRGLNLHAHISSTNVPQLVAERQASVSRVTVEGVAVFSIKGPMMKSASSLSGGTSTVQLRQAISHARRDPAIIAGLLVMDTPGGTVKGNFDLAAEVYAFAAEKPIYAFVEDMTASAGVSVASQATKRFANNAAALYGSMGTYSVLVDESAAAERLGVKVHVIRAGEFKGMGEPGAAVTEKHLAEAQRIVNAMNESYLGLIASGLKKPIEAIRKVADGRVLLAKDAVGLGLLDGVQSFDATYAQLLAAAGKQASAKPVEQTAPSSVAPVQTAKPVAKADPVAEFSNAVREIAGPNPSWPERQAAVRQVARERPSLHAAYLWATGQRMLTRT